MAGFHNGLSFYAAIQPHWRNFTKDLLPGLREARRRGLSAAPQQSGGRWPAARQPGSLPSAVTALRETLVQLRRIAIVLR